MKRQNTSDSPALPLVTLSNTEKRYNRHSISLHPVSLSFNQGQFISLVGPNGSGKSTLIKLITRLIHPSSGSMDYDDPEIIIGYVPEIVDLPGNFTGLQMINLMKDDNQHNSFVDEFIELFGVSKYIEKPITKLSKGMQKKIGMLCALSGNPNFLVLDEPLEGLDTIDREKLLKFLKAKTELGLTVVLSTHILYGLENMTDVSYFIKDGRMLIQLSGDKVNYFNAVDENKRTNIESLLQNKPDNAISEVYHILYGGKA